jgi:hypothetical protein
MLLIALVSSVIAFAIGFFVAEPLVSSTSPIKILLANQFLEDVITRVFESMKSAKNALDDQKDDAPDELIRHDKPLWKHSSVELQPSNDGKSFTAIVHPCNSSKQELYRIDGSLTNAFLAVLKLRTGDKMRGYGCFRVCRENIILEVRISLGTNGNLEMSIVHCEARFVMIRLIETKGVVNQPLKINSDRVLKHRTIDNWTTDLLNEIVRRNATEAEIDTSSRNTLVGKVRDPLNGQFYQIKRTLEVEDQVELKERFSKSNETRWPMHMRQFVSAGAPPTQPDAWDLAVVTGEYTDDFGSICYTLLVSPKTSCVSLEDPNQVMRVA